MDGELPGSAPEALEAFLGQWSGTTQWEATAWGPARTASAEVVFARAAAGLAVTMSYRHTDADGSRTDGVGVFTVDRSRPDILWYHVNSLGLPPERPARASWQDGTLTIERRSDRGTARHTFTVEDGVLTHAAGLRLGSAEEFIPFMTTVCRRVPETAAIPA
ncbi:DUF1579 domain-containing protein [Arthrobacter sp. B3I4]|uniref:DUF1579 domain-containing protein n=1 Tax=Arthrobacter sp. B3I4 TaxID=3042267 RepID=UPI00278826C8|nr:DUF1579 domain-containing protein [Arthrobacter sp. B3I4]MDQ0756950.1 hypothetical protein [Arthrobacter sp. B3I4]